MSKVLSSDAKLDVVGMGALNMDHWYEVPTIELDGEQVITNEGTSPGGSSANTIFALGKLGLKTAFLGVVGNDQAGEEIVGDFKEANVVVSGIARKPDQTGYTICLVDSLAHRSIYVNPGINSSLSNLDLEMSWLHKTRALHFSSFIHDAQLDLQIELVQQLPPDVLLSFAPGSLYCQRGLSPLLGILTRTDVLFINQQELTQLGGENFDAAIQAMHKVGCRKVVVTLGGRERLWFASDGVHVAWGRKKILGHLPIKDSIGAGDAFTAGFLYGLLTGKDLQTCGIFGQLVAEFCLSRPGPREGLPSSKVLSQAFQALNRKVAN